MPGFLRQSTASQSRALGPFVSDSDFKTPQTGLTIANTDIKLVVNGGSSANKNSGGGTHRVNGVYGVTFDATDTATVGEMDVSVSVSGALIVFDKFYVLEEAVFDAFYASSSVGYVADQPVNTTKFGGTTVTARDIGASVLLSSGTGTGQVKLSSGYVAPNWGDVGNPTTTVNLSGTSTLALEPTTPGRKLDVTTTGEAGIDWSNIGAPTTTQNLSGTTVKAVTDAVSANVTQISGDTTAADNAESFFDGTGYAGTNNVIPLVTVTTTATNLTNAATAGDFTATMKTSLNASTPASITGAVGSVTGNVGGNVTGSVGSVVAGVTVTTNNDKTGYALSASGVDGVWDEVMEGSVTARQSMRLANSANGGILAGAATTTVTIRDLADTKDRVTASVDGDGNRTAVTLDLT